MGIGLIAAERGTRYGGYGGIRGHTDMGPGCYSYGSYGTHRKQNTLLVKVVPWRSHRESREEAIDLRVEAERDATAATAAGKRSNVPDPSDDDSWIA